MDDLAAMRVFVRVVEAGGLSAAGRAMGLAPSSVSRRISELENMLGVKLLRRTTRKLSLTEVGETYYERTRAIVRSVEEANLAVTQERAGPSGILRIAAPASIARLHIVTAVAAFQMQYPAVRVVMRVADRMVDIVDEGLDVAIRVGRLEDSSLIASKVGEARRLLCGSPLYVKRMGMPERPGDLANHAALTFRSHPGTNLWRFRKGNKTIEVRATGPFFADDGETLIAAACAGIGLILVPEWLVGEEISNGRLVEVLKNYSPDPAVTPLYAVYAPGPYTAPKVRMFVDFLAGRFSRNYAWTKRR